MIRSLSVGYRQYIRQFLFKDSAETDLACYAKVGFILHRTLEHSSVVLNKVKVDGRFSTRVVRILNQSLKEVYE
jgi:hypothetical protein